MDDIRASIGLVQLGRLIDDLRQRAEIRKIYIKQLSLIDDIIIPYKNYTEFSSNYIFPMLLKNSTFHKRDKIREKLAETGIQTSVHYPAVHRFSIYKEYFVDLPKTEYVTDNLITLPMYSNLKKNEISIITNLIQKLLRE
jgi:dTDP-4-amino-4,6-dideoxygalactose transaminase